MGAGLIQPIDHSIAQATTPVRRRSKNQSDQAEAALDFECTRMAVAAPCTRYLHDVLPRSPTTTAKKPLCVPQNPRVAFCAADRGASKWPPVVRNSCVRTVVSGPPRPVGGGERWRRHRSKANTHNRTTDKNRRSSLAAAAARWYLFGGRSVGKVMICDRGASSNYWLPLRAAPAMPAPSL